MPQTERFVAELTPRETERELKIKYWISLGALWRKWIDKKNSDLSLRGNGK
jgi:hypothetical protein